MKKINRREMLLLAVPAILLVGALVAQFRPNEVRRTREHFFPPNRFFIEKIEFPRPTPYEVSQGYDTKLLVVMNHGWPRPAWWDAQNSWSSQYHAGQLAFQRRNSLAPVRNSDVYAWEPKYDKARDRYTARYYLKLATVPKSDAGVVLQSKVGVGIWQKKLVSPVLPLSCEVRAPKKAVRVPIVSRRAGLSVEKFLVTFLSAAESKSQGGDDMQVRIVFKRDPEAVIIADGDSHGAMPTLTDEKGRDVSTSVGFYGLEDAFLGRDDKVRAARADLRYFAQYVFNFSGPQPARIFFNCSQSFKDGWPLSVSAVIAAPAQVTIKRKKSLTVEVPFKA
ncbi:MAG TPA: hypothetical protein VM821_05055, partial [Abditibacteriaceae bacterium]|nr:hypothetical protein [Abditibacteriaceae bacterium]